MKRNRRNIPQPRPDALKLAALGGAGLGLVCGAKADSIITFEGFSGDNSSINTIVGFGDNISVATPDYVVSPGFSGILGTPDISLEWVGQWETYTAWDGRGSVAQSDFNGGPNLSILFTPSPRSPSGWGPSTWITGPAPRRAMASSPGPFPASTAACWPAATSP
jgi:hypothetical protein